VKSASTTQNLTLALPKEVVRRVKVVAAQRGTSVSRMLVDALEQIVAHDDAYERARQRHLALLKRPLDLGTRGRASWSRDDLHER
jgi:hypothetical protein